MKRKRVIIICSILAIILVIAAFVFVIKLNSPKDELKPIETTYTAYVKINPLVKLEFKVECLEDKCNEPKIVRLELENEDAKEVYKDLNLNNKTLEESISLLGTIARNNGIQFETVDIYTNWKDKQYFENKTSDLKLNVSTVTEEKLNSISDELKEVKLEKYTISFNSDGGSNVDNQIITKGSKVSKPTDPIKSDYTFVEWKLNNQTYNFDELPNKDFTLTAIWKKKQSSNNGNNVTPPKEELKPTEPQKPVEPEQPKTINFTGKYVISGGYIQLNSDKTCHYKYEGIEPIESGDYPCTYTIGDCSNPTMCSIKNALVDIYMHYPDGVVGGGTPFTITTKFELNIAVGIDENGPWLVTFKKQ